MLVKTRLIVLHIDFSQGVHKCLLDKDGDLPCQDVLDNHQPIQCGPDILEQYLQIQSDWVSFALVDVVVEEDNTLYVYYTCMVPNALELKRGQWVETGKINDDSGNIQKMVFEAKYRLLERF